MGRLFQPAKFDWRGIAAVGGFLSDDLAYAMGYQEAGEILIQAYIDGHQADFLFYPICFCYRHFAELIMKRLWWDFRRFVRVLREIGTNVRTDGDFLVAHLNRTHSLEALARKLRAVLEDTTGEKFEPAVWQTLIESHNFDTESQRFRYPMDTEEKLAFQYQEQFDLIQIRDSVKEVKIYLLGMVDWLDEQIRGAEDYVREFRSE